MSVGNIIKKIRLECGFEVSEMALILGVDKQTIYQYEAGKRYPRPLIVRKLLDIAKKRKMKVTADNFLD